MDNVSLTIDGKKITCPGNRTILEAIRENQIAEIPTLCHDPKLPPYGSCYLCVVEVEGMNKLIPSCSSPVSNGMVVHTDNAKIHEARRTALGLLLSNHYADCLGPCAQKCPAGVDVQGYIALISEGRHGEAIRRIKEANPLPLVCGRVCVRACEIACRRNRVDEPVGIDYLKRYTADIDIEDPWRPTLAAENGKRVAIVGGGPAGLTCAYFLRCRGYAVTLYDMMPELGGMLRYGIPEYRLPKKVLDREIRWITDLGVTVRTGQTLGGALKLETLRADFDAVFLAIGAWKAKAMSLPEEETTEGVLKGADFLRQAEQKTNPRLSGRVIVVGGGNTAIDAARTSLRLGAESVTILYRRTRDEMPAHAMEIDAALAEGVELQILAAPAGIVRENGRLQGLACIQMELGEPDASGRRRPVPKAGSEYTLPCDFLISAIGQDVTLKGISPDGSLKATRQETIVVDSGSFQTSLPGVFAGGDAITGPAVAIDAIAHGRKAAIAIETFLSGSRPADEADGFLSKKERFGEIPDSEFASYPRLAKQQMPELEPHERAHNQREVELGFTPEQAALECERCLACGCVAFFDCDLRKYATEYKVDITPYLGDVRKYKIDSCHPFIALDPNKCIACGKCVRTCTEILGVAALGFVYRGFKSVVRPAMEKPLLATQCISCGNCIGACPTGAITEKMPFKKPGPWRSEEADGVCSFCSVGCRLRYRIFADHLFSVTNAGVDTHNKGFLCAKGRFGYRFMSDPDRLTRPLLKREGKPVPADWNEALGASARRLKEIIDRHGPGSVGVLVSAKLTNQELYLLQKLARVGLKTNAIGSSAALSESAETDSLDSMTGLTVSTATLEEIENADVVVAINTDFTEQNLIAELKIKAAGKRGASIVSVSAADSPLSKAASLWIDSRRGTNTVLLAGICNQLIRENRYDAAFVRSRCDGFEPFQKSVAGVDLERAAEITGVSKAKLEKLSSLLADREKKVVFVYGADNLCEKAGHDLQAIGDLLLLTGQIARPGSGLVLLRDDANAQGMADMGAAWKTEPVDLRGKLAAGQIKALLIFGENPLAAKIDARLFAGLEWMLAADFFMTPTAQKADVVLPLCDWTETSGSATACDRRVQRFSAVFPARTGRENWQVILELATRMGIDLRLKTLDDVDREINAIVPAYANVTAEDPCWKQSAFAERFPTADGRAHFAVFPLDVTRTPQREKPLLSQESYFKTKISGRLLE